MTLSRVRSLAGVRLVVPAVMALLLTSCEMELRELCYNHSHEDAGLNVHFDWTKCPEAQVSSMRVGLFNGSYVEISLEGREGGHLRFFSGQRQLIAYNPEADDLFQRGDRWSDFEIYANASNFRTRVVEYARSLFASTRGEIPMARGTESQSTIFQPGELWTSAHDGVELIKGYDTDVTMEMEAATQLYTVVIKNVENAQHITECVATLSGMSGSWYPARHQPSDTQCIIPFQMKAEGNTLSGQVRNFGHCPYSSHAQTRAGEGVHEHMLMVYAGYASGQRFYYSFDVTEAIHNASLIHDQGTGEIDLQLELEELPLPEPEYSGGLEPSVGEWQEVEIEIPMGGWS